MVFYGILQMAQKLATQHGACLALVAFWKNSVVSYHENGKNKYRKAAHMKIAASSGVLGEKIMIDSIYNSLVNDQGELIKFSRLITRSFNRPARYKCRGWPEGRAPELWVEDRSTEPSRYWNYFRDCRGLLVNLVLVSVSLLGAEGPPILLPIASLL